MKENLCELVLIVDISGSMHPLHSDTVGGINSFITSQQNEPGEAYLSVVLFNTVVKTLIENENISNVKPIDTKAFSENGCTALYDAIGTTIDSVGKRLAALDEKDRPSKVIVAILTDGQENSSIQFTKKNISKKIQHQRDMYKWEFLFLAANQDAWEGASMLSIDPNKSFTYDSNSVGTATAYSVTTDAVKSMRAGNVDIKITNK
jgi:uncharacterized protein YegL